MQTMTLQSNDGRIFVVELAVARRSGTICTMLDACGFDDATDEAAAAAAIGVVPLPNVRGVILEKVLIWAQYHRNDHPTATSSAVVDPSILPGSVHELAPEEHEMDPKMHPKRGEIHGWDLQFVQPMNTRMLFEVMQAACYLDMPDLHQLAAKKFAMALHKKGTVGMALVFGVQYPSDDPGQGEDDDAATSRLSEARKRQAGCDNMAELWEKRRRRLQ